jgi:hypothetical protein
MAVEIPEGALLGPKMQALRSDKQRRFAWVMATGVQSAAAAARLAGYVDSGSLQDNGKSAVRVTAHHLMQNPAILDAIEEATRATLRGLAPVAVSKAREILEDRKHPYHGRMIETVLDRTGFFARSEHMVKVEHGVDEGRLVELARRLAAENGIPVERLLGSTQSLPPDSDPRVIEGEVVKDGAGDGSGAVT